MIPHVDWGCFLHVSLGLIHVPVVSCRVAGLGSAGTAGRWASVSISVCSWPGCVAIALFLKVWSLGQKHLYHLGILILELHTRFTE